MDDEGDDDDEEAPGFSGLNKAPQMHVWRMIHEQIEVANFQSKCLIKSCNTGANTNEPTPLPAIAFWVFIFR